MNDSMVIHLKNGIPDSPQSGKLEPSANVSSEAGERQWPDVIKIAKDAAEACRETIKLFEGLVPTGSVHEIQPDVSQGAIDQFGSWLNDPRRSDGEFNSAIVTTLRIQNIHGGGSLVISRKTARFFTQKKMISPEWPRNRCALGRFFRRWRPA